jgi:hypothetical protein
VTPGRDDKFWKMICVISEGMCVGVGKSRCVLFRMSECVCYKCVCIYMYIRERERESVNEGV